MISSYNVTEVKKAMDGFQIDVSLSSAARREMRSVHVQFDLSEALTELFKTS